MRIRQEKYVTIMFWIFHNPNVEEGGFEPSYSYGNICDRVQYHLGIDMLNQVLVETERETLT
jgi:hypothetical protein